jgi:hypothetical protein
MVQEIHEKWLVPGIIIGALIFFPFTIQTIGFVASGILNNEPIFNLYFLYLIIFIIIGGSIFFYSLNSYTQHNRRKKIEQGLAKRSETQASTLPKKFNYYCNSCLFQTNEYSKKCPKCGSGTLERVS